MNSFWIVAASAFPAFLIGYMLRRVTLKWENKATSAQAVAELQAEQLKSTVSASLDGIIIIDAQGCIVEFSESAEQIFGFRKTDILGRNMAELIVPERYRDAHNKGMARMRETGKANILGQRIEIEAMRANGEEFMSELAISRSRSSTGDIFIAYIRDISVAKAAEQALRDAKDAAELANKAKTQFISAMSHEIRTPFNAVLGILDILGETRLSKDQKQLVQTAEHTSRSLLRIINDVLDYARISSGSVKIVNAPFAAVKVFDDVERLFAVQAKEKNIDLIVDSAKAKPIHLDGDAGRIRQILMNFVSNALKYTRDGKVELITETHALGNGEWALLCKVRDNGLGIKKDKLKHLFDEFYMAEEVDLRASEGTGLGLTICKVLTNMMGGEIGVESELGEGSTFWVKLPLAQITPAKEAPKGPDTMANIQGKQILLAEDNATNRMVVSRILEKQGAVLTLAVNGVEALSHLETAGYDLLLTDIFMPEMGGKELVTRLRAGDTPNASIPVIGLTAMGDIHEAEELKDYGVDQVMLKPFNAKDLIRAIADQCARPRDFGPLGERSLNDQQPMTASAKAVKKSQRHAKKDIEMRPEDYEIDRSGGLLEGLDADDLREVKVQFSMDLEQTTQALRAAIEARDIKAVEFASHTLKGLTGLYGFKGLSKVAALTNSHCFSDKIEKMVVHGTRAIEIADVTLLNLDDLFQIKDEAA
jgi:PAS domain S-box-containing protein